MLIVSKFHDFYDSIKAFGIDKTVVYQRKQERFIYKKGPGMWSDWSYDDKHFAGARIIGFCGKLYPVLVKDNKIIYDKKEALKLQKRTYVWSKDELGACFSEYLTNPELLKIFRDKNTPIFLYGDYLDNKYIPGKSQELIINPRLKDLGFQSVKDPVTAFQEIYMFLSGVLGVPERPMIKISDKEMAKKKGHDGKYSFKKTPSKK